MKKLKAAKAFNCYLSFLEYKIKELKGGAK